MQRPRFIGPRVKQLHTLTNQCMRQTFEQEGLTHTQSRVLGYLSDHQEPRPCPKDVEEAFSLSHPTVSGILARLEEKGFLVFQTDAQDRRCKRITVTDKALGVHAQVRATIDRMEAQMTEGFTDEEKMELSDLLDRVIRNMGGEPCGVPGPCERKVKRND